MQSRKKVCPFFLLDNSRPLSPWGPLDSLSTCLGTDSLNIGKATQLHYACSLNCETRMIIVIKNIFLMLFLEPLSEIIIQVIDLASLLLLLLLLTRMLQLPSGKPRGIVLFIFHPQGLEEVWRIMSSVWKTPRGSNAMPEMMVKIIGSKHFRYLVEKPKM